MESKHNNPVLQPGQPAPAHCLIDLEALERAFHETPLDPADPLQRVSFGTSGHRGSPLKGTFLRAHIMAIAQAICEVRRACGISGPLFLGHDTHHISAAAENAALEVLAANGVTVVLQEGGTPTPTPAVSRAILRHNAGRTEGLADGIVVTPSHNPPEDGGIKYNPPHGGPAEAAITRQIEQRANELLQGGNREVKQVSLQAARATPTTHHQDLMMPYVEELSRVLDLEAVRSSGLRIGVDPLGGASLRYWEAVRERYGVALEVVNSRVDGRFAFMPVDHDGRIRMDPSSRFAMAGLTGLKEKFDIAFGNDPDADRHGIVTRSSGLLNPNAYLAVAVEYLLARRQRWSAQARVGKTLVSSVMIDRVTAAAQRQLCEVPVGFKWFALGLYKGTLCFGGEESAGASFLQTDGRVWTTDKDGLLLGLLAAEITARTGKDPGELYRALEERFGAVWYARVDRDITPEGKRKLAALSPEAVQAEELAGDKILQRLTRAPGNDQPIGGLKVVTEGGWFAARPSGTENKYKIYAESTRSAEHLARLQTEASALVERVLR